MPTFPSRAIQHAATSSPGIWLTNRVYGAYVRRQLRRALADPHGQQQQLWQTLIRRGANTAFGREHNFADIRTLADYQARVPVRRYEDLQPWIARMLNDEPDVLWPGRVRWFAESSGTTSGGKKQIPVTRAALRHVYHATGTMYVANLAHEVDARRFLRGKTLFFVGSVHRHATHPHILLGDVTALNTQMMPAYLDWLRAPSQEIALLPDWESKLTRMVETSVEQNIVHLAGMPTWMRHFAQRVLAHTGASTLRDVWPNLLALTVGGVNPQPYLPELRRLIVGNKTGDPLHVREVFNATEGFVAMQMGEDDDLTLLPNGGIFYEFVERRAAAAGDFARAIPLAGVEANVDYALLLTSYNGLWRYLMGDCVRFTATPALGKLYRLVFAGRLSESLNIASEELLVENADAALAKVCRAHGVNLVDYTATALLNANLEADAENARHLWLVEVDAPGALSSAQFARALDESLCADLYDYNKIRTGGTHGSFGLAAPLVLLVPPGTFARWLREVRGNALGAQSKVARLSSDPRHVRGVLATLPPEVVDAWQSTLSPGQRSALATARPAWSTSQFRSATEAKNGLYKA